MFLRKQKSVPRPEVLFCTGIISEYRSKIRGIYMWLLSEAEFWLICSLQDQTTQLFQPHMISMDKEARKMTMIQTVEAISVSKRIRALRGLK